MTTKWFDIDKAGLAAILERRGKAFAIFELVSNAWDAGGWRADIAMEPIPNSPYVRLVVTDDSPEGWAHLSDSFTMFSRSRRGGDPTKRGRFSLGEKLVLSICRSAQLDTMQGTVMFMEGGERTILPEKRQAGTRFYAEIRMTRDEYREAWEAVERLIPPPEIETTLNGRILTRPDRSKVIQVKLPTEQADNEGILRRSVRTSTVEIFDSAADGEGEIYEMGIPICAIDPPFRVNVLAKVPLNMERDNVTTAFRKALQAALLNEMSGTLDESTATQPWVSEAMGDSRVQPDAIKQVIVKRFGERAVVAVPGDPIANATAAATGAVVVHGGSLSADAWANVRKHNLIVSASQAFPTVKPKDRSQTKTCPTCGQSMKG